MSKRTMRALALALFLSPVALACTAETTLRPVEREPSSSLEQACEEMKDRRSDLHEEMWDEFSELNDALADLDPDRIEVAHNAAGSALLRYEGHVDGYLSGCSDLVGETSAGLLRDTVKHAHETWGNLMERCDYAPEVFGRALC